MSDKLLANAVVSCEGASCGEVSNFIQQQMSGLGCSVPSACPDYGTLSEYWKVAQAKAQGLEGVYTETWLLDAKAVLDLGKLGVRIVVGAGTATENSLFALRQLNKTDAQAIANNIYRDGLPYDIRRIAYEGASEKLKEEALKMLSSGKSTEDVARWARSQRNQLKIDYRDISPKEFVEAAEARNMKKYQNPLGPSIEWLRQNGRTWQQIMESATRTGGGDLGFGGWQ